MARSTSIIGICFLLGGCGASEGSNTPKNAFVPKPIAPIAAAAHAEPPPSPTPKPAATSTRCPAGMAEIPAASTSEHAFCIDRWEASLVGADEKAIVPFGALEKGRRVKAVTAPNVVPQGYISAVEAQSACKASGKRLCKMPEWRKACRGPEQKAWGYADKREPGRCNDKGRNPVIALFGRGRGNFTWRTMNQPELNQLENTLSKTGAHEGCTNGYGVYDMVGNLHEWVADPGGTFYGGYYQDVGSVGHGEGCGYLTTAHEARYHDYSTGFRCCADPKE